MNLELQHYDELPQGLLDCEANQLVDILAGPSLINLKGKTDEVLFISILLHGNEITGWEAMRNLLKKYQNEILPRSICLFIGNVIAAGSAQRVLAGQNDFNRIWKDGNSAEHLLARKVLTKLSELNLFAAIDIHNNTGKNPHYGCINKLEPKFLYLATLFSRTVVYFIKPDSVMSMAMSAYCPAVTIECGQPGQARGTQHVLEYLEASLHLSHFPEHPISSQDVDLFHTVATVRIPDDISIGFADAEADVELLPDIDRLNFNEIPAGTAFGKVNTGKNMVFDILDEQGRDASARFFEIHDGWILTRRQLMPSMLTLKLEIIKQDCLCYLMERISLK